MMWCDSNKTNLRNWFEVFTITKWEAIKLLYMSVCVCCSVNRCSRE